MANIQQKVDKVNSTINTLLSMANDATAGQDTTLASAVKTLISGYGKGNGDQTTTVNASQVLSGKTFYTCAQDSTTRKYNVSLGTGELVATSTSVIPSSASSTIIAPDKVVFNQINVAAIRTEEKLNINASAESSIIVTPSYDTYLTKVVINKLAVGDNPTVTDQTSNIALTTNATYLRQQLTIPVEDREYIPNSSAQALSLVNDNKIIRYTVASVCAGNNATRTVGDTAVEFTPASPYSYLNKVNLTKKNIEYSPTTATITAGTNEYIHTVSIGKTYSLSSSEVSFGSTYSSNATDGWLMSITVPSQDTSGSAYVATVSTDNSKLTIIPADNKTYMQSATLPVTTITKTISETETIYPWTTGATQISGLQAYTVTPAGVTVDNTKVSNIIPTIAAQTITADTGKYFNTVTVQKVNVIEETSCSSTSIGISGNSYIITPPDNSFFSRVCLPVSTYEYPSSLTSNGSITINFQNSYNGNVKAVTAVKVNVNVPTGKIVAQEIDLANLSRGTDYGEETYSITADVQGNADGTQSGGTQSSLKFPVLYYSKEKLGFTPTGFLIRDHEKDNRNYVMFLNNDASQHVIVHIGNRNVVVPKSEIPWSENKYGIVLFPYDFPGSGVKIQKVYINIF